MQSVTTLKHILGRIACTVAFRKEKGTKTGHFIQMSRKHLCVNLPTMNDEGGARGSQKLT